MKRDEMLSDPEALAAGCRLDFFKATGNGGQKRNKTSSAVRLIHAATGIQVTDCSERSQKRNRANALEKLRFEIAVSVREPYAPVPETAPRIVLLAHLFDLLAECNWQPAPAAARLGVSPSKLLKLLAADPRAFAKFNESRMKLHLGVLHP